MLYCKADDASRRYEIWVPYMEKNSYKETPEYRKALSESAKNGYQLTVFVGGEEPLLGTISNLLDAQAMQ